MFERSAIILAGGGSKRMNGDKGLRSLGGDPLVRHVIRRVSSIVEEVLLIVASEKQRKEYTATINGGVELLVDLYEDGSPLVGAITGLKKAQGRYAFITGCDTPFIAQEAVSLLFRVAEGFDGATFRWPNGWIEPLLAVYRVEPSLTLALEAYRNGDLRLRTVLHGLPQIRLIPLESLRALDPRLLTLFDVDTDDDLLKAETILRTITKPQG